MSYPKLKIDNYLKIFKDYTETFLSKDIDDNTKTNLKLKQDHSLRVFKNAEAIAKSLNLDDKNLFIAQLCGLFHDIGRFEQFTKYKTFKDEVSLYHGALGEKILRKEKFIEAESLDIQNIVYDAVYNHGLIAIERENPSSLLFSKITRDADKIDIFRIVAKYYRKSGPRNIALEYGLKNTPTISDVVMAKFKTQELINKDELQTLNDFKTMQLAWIFDLNFPFTKEKIIEQGHLNIVLDSINAPEQGEILRKLIFASINN
ncbi:MAG: HD domain-containing protein [Bacteroidales bacterium]|nr:HD domain-containing protein [Bacteroidales bacterium]MDD4217226.1 HD domain-containing protein [Bacteroidales bacterium]MDY0141071.1 HD domain-containing protein [Bacteroidales bacterium]